MKIFSILLLMATGFTVNAQSSFHITGSINGVPSGEVKVTYIMHNQPKWLQSEIKKGQFSFSGNLPEPQRLTILFTTTGFNGKTDFFAGNESISISVDTAHPESPAIKGSATQKDFETYHQLVISVERKSEALNRTGAELFLSGKLTELQKDSLFRVHDDLDREKRLLIAAFAKEHPASPVSSWAIGAFYGFEPDLEEILPVFSSLSERNKHSIYGRQITEIIEAAKKTAIGKKAENFIANDTNGKPVSLSSFRGKYLLVDFWASWCGPCRAENPNVVKTYQTHHSEQFDILGVSLDAKREAWIKAINTDNLVWKQVSELKAWDSNVVAIYGLKGLPFNMLLDKEGRIIAKNLRGAALGNKLKEVLN